MDKEPYRYFVHCDGKEHACNTLADLEVTLQQLKGRTAVIKWSHGLWEDRVEVMSDGSIYDSYGSRHLISPDGQLNDTRFSWNPPGQEAFVKSKHVNFRYHAWTTRSRNGQQFSSREHLLYACCAAGIGALVFGAFGLCFFKPSMGTLALVVLVSVFAWWVMARTPN